MTPFLLASIGGGIVMGFWLDRLVEAAQSRALMLLGAAALGATLAAGQDWAGIALGCLLGARVMAPGRPQGR
ncbi:hypothetical protein [Paracraurococcus ruber]|uniref:Uncharacterized protein n=1 Tax=Paracraurococcus ruber TaxID=77675 RepID=A0ABS1D269_9PROT|nr:hypothetical protein [Paracraurococcus ruber]MBK1660646.1 hypothetical protein [Paracraurococcus ruber]TDG26598.1 hypothetical protein E2C05_25425 [Paracraurococcus ruber]